VRANFCEAQQMLGFEAVSGLGRAKKSRGFVTVNPGFCYVKKTAVTVFSHLKVLPEGAARSAFAGGPGFAPWNAQALAPLPQAFTAHTELAGQFGFGHVVLVLEHEMLEVVFQ